MERKTLTKLSNWQSALAEWHEYAQRRSFAWGQWDCTRFVISAIKAQTGVQVFNPTWKDKAEAEAALGEQTLPERFANVLETEWHQRPVAPNLAQNGDPVVCWALRRDTRRRGYLAGIAYNGRVIVPVREGVGHIPINEITHAWRLGNG